MLQELFMWSASQEISCRNARQFFPSEKLFESQYQVFCFRLLVNIDRLVHDDGKSARNRNLRKWDTRKSSHSMEVAAIVSRTWLLPQLLRRIPRPIKPKPSKEESRRLWWGRSERLRIPEARDWRQSRSKPMVPGSTLSHPCREPQMTRLGLHRRFLVEDFFLRLGGIAISRTCCGGSPIGLLPGAKVTF